MLRSPALSLAGASLSPGDQHRSLSAIFGGDISGNEQMGSEEEAMVDALRNEHSTVVMQHSTALLRTKQVPLPLHSTLASQLCTRFYRSRRIDLCIRDGLTAAFILQTQHCCLKG